MLLRDAMYTTAWFGLMTTVWFGWAQEAPLQRLRRPLIAGSIVGGLVAIGFGVLTALHWQDPSALEGRYPVFGIVVGAEVVLAGLGALFLSRTRRSRWMAWWVALVVAVHFLSLAWLLDGPSLAVLAVIEVFALVVAALRMRGDPYPTSRFVGPIMGSTLLVYALVSGAVTLIRISAAYR